MFSIELIKKIGIAVLALVVIMVVAWLFWWVLSGSVPEGDEQEVSVVRQSEEDKYINDVYDFSFTIPSGWVFQREERNTGGDPLRVYLTVPGFKEEVLPQSEDMLSISVTNETFDELYENMVRNVGKEDEVKLTIAGREAIKRIGKHEFGGYLTVIIVPNEGNAVQFILRTNEDPYVSQFETLLESFEFAE